MKLYGIPYVPGTACGRVRTTPEGISPDHIALITQNSIEHLSTRPAGFLVIDAAPFSHTMIALLGMGVPAVLIDADQARELRDGMEMHIDGLTGQISDTPLPEASHGHDSLPPGSGDVARMADGDSVQLLASVRTPAAARQAAASGAQGIGLVRSEFLLPADGSVPGVAFYRHAFREIFAAAAPLPVTIRLLDAATDKIPAWLGQPDRLTQPLGLQGVRLYQTHPVVQVVEAQLRALEELRSEFEIRLLVPFLVRLEELQFWQDWIGHRLSLPVAIGAMAETVASVLEIRAFLEASDFVAIGCNDLMQAVFSADRDQADLRHYLDPYAPVLHRLFRQIAANAGDRLDRVQLCGLLPQVPRILPILLGLGYRRFSVDSPFLPHLARTVSESRRDECEALALRVCECESTAEVLRTLQLPTDRHAPFLS